MNAEIISVGTELLLGDVVNTDATIVARALTTIGVNLRYTGTVGDNGERLEQALEQALERSDLVITTGGLGPTEDDLTKETIAKIGGKPLVQHEESLQRLEAYFAGRSMSENQYKQVMLPQDCYVLQNDCGTAPGCVCTTPNGKRIAMLPGPPSELEPMLQHYLIPYLQQDSTTVIHSHNIRVFGKGEGAVAQEIAPFTQGSNPTVATYAAEGEMFVRVTAKAESPEEAQKLCAPVVEQICEILGDVVYGVDVENLEECVIQALQQKQMTLATAESCTGGLVAKRLTDIAGSSAVFEMGAVTYSNRIKSLLIGVSEELLKEYGAVSEQVARAMAEGVRAKAGSSLGVGITGIAGPSGGSEEKPVGLVYLALSDGQQTWVRKMPGGGMVRTREYYRCRAASTALDMVRRYLHGLSVNPEEL
ncbi:MAG: competence/damage-inducible protein A [Clostridiales bacterium]|jgi:nicotinamide-nucleotide amidase|nr:competence/damage-inducible protein A [Clostridiales bacterium]